MQVLLEENNIDVAVRVGDMCGFLVEHFARKQKWQAVSEFLGILPYLIYTNKLK